MTWIVILIALAAGAANPFQSGTNAELNKQLGQPIMAGLWVYLSGFAGLMLIQAFARQSLPDAWNKAGSVHWWAWAGGLISIAATMAGLTLAHRLGSGLFTGLSLTASVVTSVLIDQFGLIGFKQHTASPARLAGCALLIAGVWLVARF